MGAILDIIGKENLQKLDTFAKGLSKKYDLGGNLEGVKYLNKEERNLSIAIHICMDVYTSISKDLNIKIKGIILHEECTKGDNDFVFILEENEKSKSNYSKVYDIVVNKRKIYRNLECMFVETKNLNMELLKADGYRFEFSFEL